MAEEFQESEILFRESVEVHQDSTKYDGDDFPVSSGGESRNGWGKRRELQVQVTLMIDKKIKSVPINIPEIINVSWFRSDFGDDDGEFVPPHVIVGRRVAGKVMAFSLCTGNGRTLKGRDLSEFRNSILRMTGFLET